MDTPVFAIQLVPGDEPRALEQINGDLLVPVEGRPTLEKALLMAEDALPKECRDELKALADARRLLGLHRPDREKERLLAHLLRVRDI